MCRMLAFVSNEPRDVAEYIGHLARLSARGNLVDRWEKRPGGNHPDGWGVFLREPGEGTRLVRSGKPAAGDAALRGIKAKADLFIGHARYADDTDTVNEENSHPFLVQGITLGHNGTFRGRIGEEAARRKVSDTLVFLESLADRWKDGTHAGLCETLSLMLEDGELVGRYSAANMLIADGESVFALRKFRKDGDYYTLFLRSGSGLSLVASEPVDDSPGWRPLSNGELVALSPAGAKSLFLPLAV